MRRLLPAAAALAAALIAAPTAHATLPGESGRIAFAATGTGTSADGGRIAYRGIGSVASSSERASGFSFLRQCSELDGEPELGDCEILYRAPAWARGGARLAFDAGDSLALLGRGGADFRALRLVTGDDGEPSFAPSGKRLAFSGRRGGPRNVYVYDLRSDRARRIVRKASAPDWAARGRRIAFVRSGNIFTVRQDGRGVRRRTRSGGRAPSFSPSGRSIAFARRDGIYVMATRRGRARRVVRCSRCGEPAFSPDGGRIVYQQARVSGAQGGLRVVRTRNGRRLATLISNAGESFQATQPAWQPLR
jgi:Tol biopolymer transport system component